MNLKQKTVIGVVWSSFGTIGAGVVSLLITMILARLLTPGDFGMMELLVIFSVISEVFVDSGFSQAVIRDKNASNEDMTSVFYVNIIIGISIYLLLFLCAPIIASFYQEPELIKLSRVVFLTILFSSFSIIQSTNFSRNVNFKTPAIASLIAMFLAGTVAIIMAIYNWGVWALAANIVLFSFVKMLLLWIMSEWRPKGGIIFASVKKYFAFGGNLLVQGFLDKVVTNLESLLIGRVYTKSDLGYFSQGRKLNTYITQTITGIIQKVTYPVLSKIGDDKVKLKEGYRKIIGITMLVMLPVTFGVIVASKNIIIVMFGSQWLPSAPYLQWWTIMGLFVSLHSYYTNIFLVLGNSRQLLYLSMIKQTLKILIIIVLIKTSVIALIKGVVMISVLASIMYIYFGGKQIDYSLKELVGDLWQIVVAGIVGAAAIYAIGVYSSFANVPLLLGVQVIVMIGITFCILKMFGNKNLKELISIVKIFLFRT